LTTSSELAKQFTTDSVLKDGSIVTIRPALESDRDALQKFLSDLSPESRTLRFFSGGAGSDQIVDKLLPAHDRFALIALRSGVVVGHAGYYLIDKSTAEMSVVISDGMQGKGLGTILVEQLSEAGNTCGIKTFQAFVLPENVKMLDVLKELGLKSQIVAHQGYMQVAFTTSPDQEALEAFEKRDAVSAVAALTNFLRPKSIAVVGASRDPESIGGRLFRNILNGGFNGPVYPVNTKSGVVQSVVAYKSVIDCPGGVELAIIVVPAAAVPSVARECAEKGVKALVVISSGFSEIGADGAKLQAELVGICREGGMRLIGPNCMGIVNTETEVSLNGQFAPLKPAGGRVSFLSQSGALGIAVIDHSNSLGLGLSSFVSVGNKADISSNDCIQYWESDSNTDAILLYLESFGNPRKFARISKRVTRKKPIIVVKGGRSSAGFRATQSHTGALLAASDVTVDALFKQSGVIRVDTIGEMFDVASLAVTQPVPSGGNVAIITNAGGAGILAADACEALGLHVPELSDETKKTLRSFLPHEASVENPVDMIASASSDDYARTIRTVTQDPNVDSIVVIFIPPTDLNPQTVGKVILDAAREIQAKNKRIPILTTFMASHGVPSLLVEGETKIPSFPFPETAAKALAHWTDYGKWLSTPEGKIVSFPDIKKEEALALVSRSLGKAEGGWLSPDDTKALLTYYGIQVVKSTVAKNANEVEQISKSFGCSVAIKGIAAGLVHKSDADAVKLNVTPGEEAVKAAGEIKENLEKAGYVSTGFVVEPMVSGGIEMIVGVTRDPVFGSVILCGAGGVLVELLKDVSVRVAPLSDREAGEMVRSLKSFPLLNGYRGGPTYDIASVEEVILRVSSMVEDIPDIAELDINPLIVLPDGAVCVDARIRIAEVGAPPLPFAAKKR
jgi:acetyl coenzyme A synthetase (ADP forming)-like protein